jgi:hypothetical protein
MFTSRRRKRIAWDDRDEFKVRADKLREDGEIASIYVRGRDVSVDGTARAERMLYTRDPDPSHPQRIPITPFIDGFFYKPVKPPKHNIPVVIDIGWIANSNDLGAMRFGAPTLGFLLAGGATTTPVEAEGEIVVPFAPSLDFSEADNSQYVVLVVV